MKSDAKTVNEYLQSLPDDRRKAINAVRDQFERILVITHIDELKDMFPVRIDIVKTGGGSSIFVN